MQSFTFPTRAEIFQGALIENGSWVVACLETSIPWPLEVTTVRFRERDLYIIPYTRDVGDDSGGYPSVAVKLLGGEQFADGQILISHFLSTLAWVKPYKVLVDQWTGGNLPRPMGGCKYNPVISPEFYKPYLPDPDDQHTRWALGFYREGLSLNHPAYQCLSFFKVINLFARNGAAQIEWINGSLQEVEGQGAKTRKDEIEAKYGDVGEYLYGSNRCAVAHAGGHPTVDPESPYDLKRLYSDLRLVRVLAEIAIEKHFGIKSAMTVYREHLYELEGFRGCFGEDGEKTLKEGGVIPEGDWPNLPNLSVRLALKPLYEPLENMTSRITNIDQGIVRVQCVSQAEGVRLVLHLNFPEERLQIEPLNAIMVGDDGSEQSMRNYATAKRFEMDHFTNGILEVYRADDIQLLGRCDGYLPVNVDMGATVRNLEQHIERIEAAADQRCAR